MNFFELKVRKGRRAKKLLPFYSLLGSSHFSSLSSLPSNFSSLHMAFLSNILLHFLKSTIDWFLWWLECQGPKVSKRTTPTHRNTGKIQHPSYTHSSKYKMKIRIQVAAEKRMHKIRCKRMIETDIRMTKIV